VAEFDGGHELRRHPQAMNFPFTRFGRRKVVLLLLLLALASAGVVLLLRPPPPPQFVVMAVPEGFPDTRPSFGDRLLGRVPMWGWRLKQAIVGSATSIGIRGTIIELSGPEDPILSEVARTGVVLAETNGLRAWSIGGSDMNTILRRLETGSGSQVISSPSVVTSDGVTAVLSVSQNVPIAGTATAVGVILSVLPRVRRDSTDLTTVIVLTEAITNQTGPVVAPNGLAVTNTTVSIRTNLAAAARIQIPDGRGIFLLQAARSITNQHCTGVFISARPQRSAGKK
jgi:hypothetical protein